MASKADLRRMMLAHLTVIDPEENPSAQQASLADLWIDAGVAALQEDGLVWWDLDGEIPAAVTAPLAHYCAGLSPQTFGRGGKGYEAYLAPAKAKIASLKSSEELETTRVQYF